ncbi:MAG: hypothetical protein N2170_06290 [Bacteroidia bacterium]|nr:hypothetical protein [Bacteroidia bacterium]
MRGSEREPYLYDLIRWAKWVFRPGRVDPCRLRSLTALHPTLLRELLLSWESHLLERSQPPHSIRKHLSRLMRGINQLRRQVNLPPL